MNILKEKIKLFVAFPNWRSLLKRMKNSHNRKIILFGTPMHGNLGDHAIALQEQYFFEDFFPDYEYYEILMPMYHTQKEKIKHLVSPNDLIIISGGGWMGNLWLHNEIVIREIVETYSNNRVIVFPQTIFYTHDAAGKHEYMVTKAIYQKHNNLSIFVREKKSYDFFRQNFKFSGNSNVYLAPDIVLYGKNIVKNKVNYTTSDVVNLCIRTDCESQQENIDVFLDDIKKHYDVKMVSTVIKSPVVLRKRLDRLEESWNEFRNADVTITDRLHGMLFSILNGTPCIVLDNKTGKVFGVAEWLKNSDMIIRVNSLDEALKKLNEKKVWKHKEYNRTQLLDYFKKMADIIRKG